MSEIKCELCGNEIVREYKTFLNANTKNEMSICGRCSLLIEINDNLKRLLDKPDSMGAYADSKSPQGFTPVVQ